MKGNGIKHIHSSPYQPATKGFAERFVQTFKRVLITSEGSGRLVHHRLTSFLLSYRSAPMQPQTAVHVNSFLKEPLNAQRPL